MPGVSITANGSTPVIDHGGAILIVLMATAAISVLLFGAVDTGTLAVLSILIAIALTIWAVTAYRVRRLQVNTNVIQLPLVALAIFGVLQIVPFGTVTNGSDLLSTPIPHTLSLDPYATRFFVMRLFLLLLFMAALLAQLRNDRREKNIALFLIVFGAALSFYSILQRVEDPNSIYGMRQPGQAIPFGTYVNRHHFAALMEMIFGLTIGSMLMGGLKRNRWPFLLAAAVSMAIAVILTGSRGGLIGLFAAMVTIAVMSFFTRKELPVGRFSPYLVLAAGAIFFFFIAGLVVYIGGTDPLLRSTGVSIGVEDFTTGRKDFWLNALKILKDHPVTGVGMDAFGVAYSMYDASSGLFRVEQAHNDYLQMLADGGVIGFAIIAVFIYLLVGKALRKIRQTSESGSRGVAVGAFAGCMAILVHSIFDFPLRTPANSFVFLTLAALAIAQVPTMKKGKRSRS